MQVKAKETPASKAMTLSTDEGLLEKLKALRLKLAQKEKVPAYIVFSNAALQDMATKVPVTMEAFLTVNGVGQHKAERYGEQFIAAIMEYQNIT